MNDDRLSDRLPHGQSIGQKSGKRKTAATEQRRKIARMVRMGTVGRIMMGECACKRVVRVSGAGRALVNMKAEHPSFARFVREGKSSYLGAHERSRIRFVKAHDA